MIQTSYFSNYRNFPKFKKTVSISRFTPKGVNTDLVALELAPSANLLNDYKTELVSDEDYEKRYRKETLSILNPKEISKKYQDCLFLCYEKSEDFCHRKILSSWLKENGIKCEELKKEEKIIGISGSKEFENYKLFEYLIKKLISNYSSTKIITGDSLGVESYAIRFSQENDIPLEIIPTEWTFLLDKAEEEKYKIIREESDLVLYIKSKENETLKIVKENMFIYTEETNSFAH